METGRPEPIPVVFDERLSRVFGAPGDPMPDVVARAQAMFPDLAPILWEGDPATFQFSFVSDAAAVLLGHAVSRWTQEADFWTTHVVHPDDKEDAVAYCALATAKCRDHVFEYRAVTAQGQVVWLRDIVRVTVGARGIPVLLRGVMFDVTAEKTVPGSAQRHREPVPSRSELLSA